MRERGLKHAEWNLHCVHLLGHYDTHPRRMVPSELFALHDRAAWFQVSCLRFMIGHPYKLHIRHEQFDSFLLPFPLTYRMKAAAAAHHLNVGPAGLATKAGTVRGSSTTTTSSSRGGGSHHPTGGIGGGGNPCSGHGGHRHGRGGGDPQVHRRRDLADCATQFLL
jgi:hypothetical protein